MMKIWLHVCTCNISTSNSDGQYRDLKIIYFLAYEREDLRRLNIAISVGSSKGFFSHRRVFKLRTFIPRLSDEGLTLEASAF